MIRLRDLIHLAWRKLIARKVSTFFTVAAVSLGVALVTTFASLISPVRDLVSRASLQFATIRPDVVIVCGIRDEGEEPQLHYSQWSQACELSKEDRLRFSKLPQVKAVCEATKVKRLSFGLPKNYTYAETEVWGVPKEFMQRYWHPSVPESSLESGVIPVVLEKHKLNVVFDEDLKLFRLDESFSEEKHIGRELELTLGDNYVQNGAYGSEWSDGEFHYKVLSEKELKAQDLTTYNSLACSYDMLLYDKTLKLRGKLVGFHSLERTLIPQSTADEFQRWLQLRASLSTLSGDGEQEGQEAYGSLNILAGGEKRKEYSRLQLLLENEDMVEPVTEKLKEEGYHVQSRNTMLRASLVAFDKGAAIAERVVYAIGAVLLLVNAFLIWIIIAKSVYDSRGEIGLLRAVGATKRTVLHVFMMEAGILGFLGGLLGLLEGWLLAKSITAFGLMYANSNLENFASFGKVYHVQELLPETLHAFEAKTGLCMLVVTVCITCLAGVVPALRAARLDPVEALRND